MKKYGLLIFILLYIFDTKIGADYIVISNQHIIEGENIHHIQSVASISKVMTALVALEYGDITDDILISKEVSRQIGSSLYLKENEHYSLLSLLYGLMLRSGNDAAYAIAVHVGGSIENFVHLMNQKAKTIGMNDTQFNNPSGLDEEDLGNLSSVYDMALCMEKAMKHPIFQIISKTKQYKAENQRIWTNKNRLLNKYEYATGGKTGYTLNAGKTLITSASYLGFETIVVSFREDNYFMFHQNLHEKVYREYESVLLIAKGNYYIKNQMIKIIEDIRIIIKKDEKVDFKLIKSNHEIIMTYFVFDQLIERRIDIHDVVLE
ncbi:MAG: D-alanyl-D-alanine carboxypeptidase family protein [Traorella sp.]